ncbi:MAG: ABC transporter permease subunit [Deltaproteobacteria bacterium]|jgi:ABC-type nitrate/sulfonate/bicarbonate transport system permease component|nr:ABC transporter permease subunit [Deltaproteobacteria bacterium]
MSRIAPYLFFACVLAGLMLAASLAFGPELAPMPQDVIRVFGGLVSGGEMFAELLVTVSRGLAGIFWANIVGVTLGVAAGMNARLCKLASPLVAALQACPPVVWITLVMVWAGAGAAVPVATVFAATLPFVFSTTAQGVMGLNRRVLAMSRLYAVPRRRVLLSYILPGVLPYWLAGFSTALATAWKAAAVAEFLGSHQGIGSRIFWSYHKLHMEELNAWALALVMLGVFLECAVIAPLRRKAASLETRGAQTCSQ